MSGAHDPGVGALIQTKVDTGAGSVSLALEGPGEPRAALVLAHGAGGGMNSDFMLELADAVARDGFLVCLFNFPYLEQGRKARDRQGVL